MCALRSCSSGIILASLAQYLETVLFAVRLGFLQFRQTIAQTDVVVGAASYLERFSSFKGRNLSRLGRVVLDCCPLLILHKFASKLEQLVRAPAIQLIVFR